MASEFSHRGTEAQSRQSEGSPKDHLHIIPRCASVPLCEIIASVTACCVLLAAASAAVGHDQTAQLFQQARALAVAQMQAAAEPAPKPEDACRLTVELLVGDSPQAVAGLVRVTNAISGKPVTLADEILREQNWYTVAPRSPLRVPRAKLKIEALHGLETELASREIDLTGKPSAAVTLKLTRFYDAAAKGLSAGNTHLHLMKLTHAEMDRYLRLVPQADQLDLVFVSFLRRIPDERDYITNLLTDGDLGRLSAGGGVLFGNGQEHRHNFGPGGEGFGHVMLLNILKRIEPCSIGPGIMREGTDGIPLQRGIRAARADGATILWCHNTFGHEDIPNWASGLLHAQNIFDGGDHGTYEDTFYRYLNVGMKAPFSTGTDWFIYDFSRVYVPLSGELTVKRWLDQLTAGRSYITNGPLLEFTANGKAIGDTIAAASGDELRITGRALSRADFRQLELIHNGRVVHTAASKPAAGHFAADLDFRLKASEPGWLALRVPKEAGKSELGKPLFAHTSPIYVNVGGRGVFHRAVAQGLLAEMEASQRFVEEKATFANDAERQAVLGVYREAIEAFRTKIAAPAR